MTPAAPAPENREQIEYWNGPAGVRWVENEADTDYALLPFGQAALERLSPAGGESILDVGCGAGDTLLQIAARIGESGNVVGLDPSGPLLGRARERTRHLANVELVQGDAATAVFEPRFAGVFSRFGVMFFAEPVAAFAQLRRALAPGGRLAFVCWQALDDNPWVQVPLSAARSVLADLPPPPDPHAPGPFALASAERIRSILQGAGYSAIGIDAFQTKVRVRREGLDAGMDFTLRVGPVARLLAERPEEIRQAVRERLRGALAPFLRAERLEMDGRAWLVAARA